MIRKFLLGLGVVFIIIQFIRPDKNDSGDTQFDIATAYELPTEISHILETACNDCHSNKTLYPWYYNIQPVAWWLDHHVTDGKKHLNFSSFTKSSIAVQNHKFEEVIETVEGKEMPLPAYTYLGLHAEANLTDDQRKALIHWAEQQMNMLKANYPADSLIRKRK